MRDFDIDLLRAFVTIVELGGFTKAAERLDLTQSAVSLQIKRLEEGLGHCVFDRIGRSVRLTPQGELLLGYARQMLRLNDEVCARIASPDIGGKLIVGVPEDYATLHLADTLTDFVRNHPKVSLEVRCLSSVGVSESFEEGAFDIALFKQFPAARPVQGLRVWSESLVWAAAPDFDTTQSPLPLLLGPQPCVHRGCALAALDRIGRSWRSAYTSTSITSLQTAACAGLGVMVLPQSGMIPEGLTIVPASSGLPPIDDLRIVLHRSANAPRVADLLVEQIIASMDNSHATCAAA